MSHCLHKVAVVIPTIGRPAELRRMLASLAGQSRLPEQVIIVDEDGSSLAFAAQFPQLKIRAMVHRGSSSGKRNAGMMAVGPDITLVGFMDDDIVLEPAAIEAMTEFWGQAPPGLAGASFNYVNAPRGIGQGLKRRAIWSTLGLYEGRPGSVARSGFQTRVECLQQTTYVRWVSSCAALYAREILNEYRFDEWFDSYSYLEDLDFSFRIGKKYKLAVVADARFYHYPSKIGRPRAYLFGKKEVLNRLYFVAKHPELSRSLCWLALCVRAFMSAILGVSRFEAHYFQRVIGNVAGILAAVRGREVSRMPV